MLSIDLVENIRKQISQEFLYFDEEALEYHDLNDDLDGIKDDLEILDIIGKHICKTKVDGKFHYSVKFDIEEGEEDTTEELAKILEWMAKYYEEN